MRRCLDCGALSTKSHCSQCTTLRRRPRDQRNNAARGGNGWTWQRTRQAVLERDGHRCVACGVRFEVDHVVPLAAGGSNDPPTCGRSVSHATESDEEGVGVESSRRTSRDKSASIDRSLPTDRSAGVKASDLPTSSADLGHRGRDPGLPQSARSVLDSFSDTVTDGLPLRGLVHLIICGAAQAKQNEDDEQDHNCEGNASREPD